MTALYAAWQAGDPNITKQKTKKYVTITCANCGAIVRKNSNRVRCAPCGDKVGEERKAQQEKQRTLARRAAKKAVKNAEA